jgi:multidrug efflux pump subunit AcrB
MAARILKGAEHKHHNFLLVAFEKFLNWFFAAYRRTLEWSLKHRVKVLGVGLASLALMVVTYRALEEEFLPEEDRGLLLSFVISPRGATSEYTGRMVEKVENILKSTPEVEIYGSVVALAMAGPGETDQGIAFVHFKEDRKRTVQEIVRGPGGLQQRFIGEVEGAIAIPQIPKAFTRGFGAPFQLTLQSQDLDGLNRYAGELVGKLQQMKNEDGKPMLVNIRSSFEVNKPELRLDIDRDRAAALGVSVEDISRTLQILFGGLDLSRIKISGKEYYVMVQLARESRLTPQDLDRLYVRNTAGDLIQLSSVVHHQVGAAPNAIEHYNRMRSATISGTPVGIPLGTALNRVEEMMRTDLPGGFLYSWSGESRDLRDTGHEVWAVLILALIIVYMVLAAQFESLIHPLTVILAVPLAAVGAFGLLWLLNFGGKIGVLPVIPAMNLNLFSQIGLVLLVGLVTKNSILLVEFANQQRAKGASARDAMFQAGIVRLRPILMTAFSTIAGILPIAIGFGAGAESRRPMGVAIVGGMLTSTFLTLIIIPVVYTFFSDIADKLMRKPKHVGEGEVARAGVLAGSELAK